MTKGKAQNIFNEFKKVSKDTWLELVKNDLKEKKQLNWSTDEGIDVAPFYTKQDLIEKAPYKIPATTFKDWKYFENIFVKDCKKANTQALFALNNGADGLIFNLDDETPDLNILLKDIHPVYCNISFKMKDLSPSVLNKYFTYLEELNIARDSITGTNFFDAISEWTLQPYQEFPKFSTLGKFFERCEGYKNFTCFTVSTEIYKNSGANIVQEAALTISAFLEYLRQLTKEGIPPDAIFKKTLFKISIGSNYFFEIAKIRVIRTLILQIAKMYDIRNYFIEDLKIHTETSWWTKTAKDPYTNILRNTTEAMAGILGGCSSISILPHDIVINDHDDVYFSQRIARNVSNILKEEAYLNKISDPVAGTYYIESLTDMMLVKIWDVVQEIETQGGFIAAFKTGYIKNMVKPNFEYSIASFIKEKKKIVGANYFKNQEDIDLVNKVKKTRKGWFEWDRLTETSEGK